MKQDDNPNKIYLRPSEKTTPTKYISSPEEGGLIIYPEKYLGMFTARSTPNAGPPGPPGVDTNSKLDTIIASCSDENTPIVAGAAAKTTFRAPYPMRMDEPGFEGYIRGSLTNAPTGGPFQFRVQLNGVDMTNVPIQIDADSLTSVGSVVSVTYVVANIPDDGEFRVYVDQVGSTFAGSGLKVAVTAYKIDP
jgi:hypothetical protein